MDERALIVGAVATVPESVALWEGIRAHFAEVGAPMDYTLYSNHERLTDQLMDGEVDVAWLSPLAYVRARRRAGRPHRTPFRRRDAGGDLCAAVDRRAEAARAGAFADAAQVLWDMSQGIGW